MHKLWLIIKREYITRVKTKGFVIGTLIVPLIGIGSILLIVFLVGHTHAEHAHCHCRQCRRTRSGDCPRPGWQASPNGQPQFTVEETMNAPAIRPTACSRNCARDQQRKARRLSGDSRRPSQPFELHMRIPIISR